MNAPGNNKNTENPSDDFTSREEQFRKLLETIPADQHPGKVLDAALGLVDLQYEKANSAKQIVELVRTGKTDQALQWMENYDGCAYPINDEFFYWKKVVLYIRCLIELTLLKEPQETINREALEKIINHWDDHVPIDKSLVYWEDNLSPWLVFLLATEMHKEGIDYTILYRYATEWDIHWINEKGPYTPEQIEVLLYALDSIKWERDKQWAYEKLINALLLQGETQLAEEIATDHQIEIKDSIRDKEDRTKDSGLSEFYSAWKNDAGLEEDQTNPLGRIFALFRLAIALKENGNIVEAEDNLQKALTLIREIKDQKLRNNTLKKLSRLHTRLGNTDKSLEICRCIDNIEIKDEACIENSHILALNGKIRESVAFIDAMLEVPAGSSTIIYREEEISSQISKLCTMGRYEDGLHLLGFLPYEKDRNFTLLKTIRMLLTPEKVKDALRLADLIPGKEFKTAALIESAYVYVREDNKAEAETLLEQSMGLTETFDKNYERGGALERIALGYGMLKNFGKAVEIMGKYHEATAEKRLSQGETALTFQLYRNMVELVNEEQVNAMINLSENENIQNRIRQYLAVKLAKEGKTDEAINVWKDLMGKEMDLSHTDIIRELIDQGRYEETLALIDTIVLKEKKDAAWCSIAEHLAQMGETEQSLATAKKIHHHYHKTTALTALAEAYIKNNQYALALELKPMIPPKYVVDYLARLTNFLAEYIQSESISQTGKNIFALIAGIPNKAAVKHKLMKTVITLAKKDSFQLAEEIGLSISNIDTRQDMWKSIGYTKVKENGVDATSVTARQFAHEETIRYFKQGIVNYCYELTSIEEALGIMKEISHDTRSIEFLLKHVAFNEVFRGNPDPDIIQRLNRSLNIQWAIDIAEKMKEKPGKPEKKEIDHEDDGSDDYFRYLRAWAKR
jgi:tetratricopeptide (TPR) repeat protein